MFAPPSPEPDGRLAGVFLLSTGRPFPSGEQPCSGHCKSGKSRADPSKRFSRCLCSVFPRWRARLHSVLQRAEEWLRGRLRIRLRCSR